jgi:hypothetical protein
MTQGRAQEDGNAAPPPNAEMAKRVEALATKSLDRLRASAATTTKTLLTWLVFLVLIFWQNVLPVWTDAASVRRSKSRVAAASVVSERKSAQREIQERLVTNRDEPIEMPFGIKLRNVPAFWLPTVWSAVAFGVLFYLVLAKRRLIAIGAQTVRLLREHLRLSGDQIADYFGGLPFWLVPFPRVDGPRVSVIDLQDALGWRSSYRRARVWTGVAALALVVLLGITLYVAFLAGVELAPKGPHTVAILCLTPMIAVATALCLAELLVPAGVIPDRYAFEHPHGRGRRRFVEAALLALTAVAVTGLGLRRSAPSPVATSTPTQRFPRFRRKRSPAVALNATEGIYLNPDSRVYHIGGRACQGCFAGFTLTRGVAEQSKTNPALLNPTPEQYGFLRKTPTQMMADLEATSVRYQGRIPRSTTVTPKARLHRGGAVCGIAELAEASIRNGEIDESARVLAAGVRLHPRSISLADELAAIAVRAKRPQLMAQLTATLKARLGELPTERTRRRKPRHRMRAGQKVRRATIDTPPPSERDRAEERFRKWGDPQSTWRKRILVS